MYIHALQDWPKFHWDKERISKVLPGIRHKQGRLTGRMEALGFKLRQEAELNALSAEVIKSSEIEGETLDAEQVRSSIARRLGMDIGALKLADRNVEGAVEMMLDATRNYSQPLTTERLFSWHSSLFPAGRSGMKRVRVGVWRDDSSGPMQVVSGPIGKEIVHFEAPVATRLDAEVTAFLDWFNSNTDIDLVLKAAFGFTAQTFRRRLIRSAL
jgi:Fic family protein